ncbi:MAG: hypothetical protein CFH26_00849 [Alphaproteobacteria bacterium MarineAlpha6_Bin4]|nr:MAG: hypothetical protein CFH25_00754 [Alphaproteobacteria bacterium MarineAlpha6_Bin3]PPR37212.1 MAG: hypothetical protein CFH26_00849 [Alphaproteobacteria bacterium MarineAlpha6_Bin4]
MKSCILYVILKINTKKKTLTMWINKHINNNLPC